MFEPRDHVAAPNELAGRVVAITGASSGIGRAVALACARHQANVVLIGRNKVALEAVHDEIAAAGSPEASIALLDLEKAVASDYDELANALLNRYGRLDGLLHNAGLLGTLTPIEHYDVATWCRVLHVNVTAAFALTRVLLPALKNPPMLRWCSRRAASAGVAAPTGVPTPFRSSRSKVSRRCCPMSSRASPMCG